MAKNRVIPGTTARRLPLYYHYSRMLHGTRKSKASSTELGEAVQVDNATTCRDFSYSSELGKHGYDYDVENLMSFFVKTLNGDELTSVALIGVGDLGSALLKCKFHQSNSVHVSCALDMSEDIAGHIVDGVPVYPMEDMMEQIRIQQIEVAILTIPARKAQEVINKPAKVGVKGILNFMAARLVAPPGVLIQNVDLTNKLQALIYFLHHDSELIDKEE